LIPSDCEHRFDDVTKSADHRLDPTMTSPVMVMSTIIWWMFWAWLVHPTIVRAAAVAKTTHSNDTFASTGVEEHQSYPGGLYWNDLSVRTDDDGAFLVHNCRGMVFDGHLCAILGPSGAGKSTFLHALAGAVSSASHLNVRGDIFLYDADHQTRERLQIDGGHIGWLSQHDHFFTLMTVKETLDLAAFLQLPTFSKRQRQRRVKSILTSLGLKDLQHRRVGESSNQRSLSGGEKRRLSLAIELVSQTKLFFGDEPTSGLDSSMAFKVVRLIKKVIQQKNIPCILTLHQPQSSIFKLLDSLILLAPGGRVCYMGPSNKAVQYFAKLGYPCPTQTNPAEYLLDLVSIDSDDPRQASEDELRISRLASAFADEKTRMRVGEDPSLSTMLAPTSFLPVLSPFRESGSGTDAISQMVEDISIHQHTHKEAKHMTSFASNSYRVVQRFGKLLLRSWRQNYRNHKVNLIRLVAAIGNAFLFSRIFQSIKIGLFTSRSVADRVALLTFAVINMSMLS
jgi:ABC-type multidrug transport system ATPase subunit